MTVLRHRVLNAPETNVALFAFLLNFPWEFWQVPFYESMPTEDHWAATLACTQATFGDAGIALASFWVVAGAVRSRRWILKPGPRHVWGFIGVGVAITILFEWKATEWLNRWEYADIMPTLPILGTGLVPLLQWIVLPPILVWLVRRQLS